MNTANSTKPRLILATRNAHKTAEIRAIIGHRFEVVDVTSFPECPEIEETGTTFLENARLKAEGISAILDGWILSDDSGLEVDALEGAPGVWSSSFGGEEGNHARNNTRLIEEMEGKMDRRARFRCTMVLAKGGHEQVNFSGTVEGHILTQLKGTGGFGYDPLFVPTGHDATFSELGASVKNTLSHRARALAQIIAFLEALPDSLKIAAVFATMNRAQTAVACVRALAAQTRPPEWVVVADNVSSDETHAALLELRDLPFELVIHRMKKNRGNAGGVEEAMELAFQQGADAVWILDDDSWPRSEALAALLAKPWQRDVVRHALQIDPRTGRFTWPLQVADGRGGWRLVNTVDEMPEGDGVRSRITWTGALVPHEVRKAIGPVLGELFIRGEDEEYPLRMEKGGFPQEAVVAAVMDHPGPDDIVHWKFLGKHFFFERGLADWKLYYKIRNMVWLKQRQAGNQKALVMAATYALAVGWIDGIGRMPLVWEAIRDGWTGKLGKWARHL